MRTQRFDDFRNKLGCCQNKLHGQRLAGILNSVAQSSNTVLSDVKAKIQNSGDDTVELLFHDYIGDWWVGSDSQTVVNSIKAAKGKKIRCDINSFGGDAYAGISIYNALIAHDAEVEIVVSGIAYSAASIIAMAGDTIKIAGNGTIGIHPASIYTYGNKFDLAHYQEWLASIDEGLIDTYTARTGQSREQVVSWFTGKNNDGSFFSGTDSVKYGFADELLPLKKKSDEDTHDSGTQNAGNSSSSVPAAVAERIRKMAERQSAEAASERRA